MQLKKNDKIILIVAIIVFIVAAIGIALYSSPKTSQQTPVIPESGTNTYEVTWTEKTASLSEISESAQKNSPFETTITIPKGNLKSITFNLTWVDNKALLRMFGLDTLTLEVTTPDDKTTTESATSARRTKAGQIEITFDSITSKPTDDPVEASSPQDAENQLEESSSYDEKWTNEEFKITVSVSPGERFLWRLRDKGNSFTLNVEYTYYDAEISEIVETTYYGGEELFQDTSLEHPIIGIIVSTGSGVRW